MASDVFPDDPDLAYVHATEAIDEEQTAVYAAEQLEAETAAAEAFAKEAAMEAAEARAEEAATMADLQVQLEEARAELAAARVHL
jgi:hypothetical protein